MVKPPLTCISGHRRLAACRKLGLETVEVVVKDVPQTEEVYWIIAGNHQRSKTYLQILQEIKHLYGFYGRNPGKRTDLEPLVRVPEIDYKTTRDRIASDLGISASSVSCLLFVDKHMPEIVEQIGKTITLAAAWSECRKRVNQGHITKTNQRRSDAVRDMYVIYNHSSADMHELEDETVQLVITSPPYWLKRLGREVKQQAIGQEPSLDGYIDHHWGIR